MKLGSRKYWIVVAGYVALLFSLQPRLGFWVDAFKARWGVPALENTTWVASALTAGVLIALLRRSWHGSLASERAVFVAALVLYGVGVILLETPQERLHYVEYGLIAALIYGGLSARGPEAHCWRCVVIAVVVTAALGYLDERLQGWFWERRYFDWRDVRLNAQAALLGVATGVPLFNGHRRRTRRYGSA